MLSLTASYSRVLLVGGKPRELPVSVGPPVLPDAVRFASRAISEFMGTLATLKGRVLVGTVDKNGATTEIVAGVKRKQEGGDKHLNSSLSHQLFCVVSA